MFVLGEISWVINYTLYHALRFYVSLRVLLSYHMCSLSREQGWILASMHCAVALFVLRARERESKKVFTVLLRVSLMITCVRGEREKKCLLNDETSRVKLDTRNSADHVFDRE